MKLSWSIFTKGFRSLLDEKYGKVEADRVWRAAEEEYLRLRKSPFKKEKYAYCILPVAAIYKSIYTSHPEDALPLIRECGTKLGYFAYRCIRIFTSIPGMSLLSKRLAPSLAMTTSSEKKGYKREIVKQTKECIVLDITECPLYELSKKIGFPEVCQYLCCADDIYQTGINGISVKRTTSVAEGDPYCEYKIWMSSQSPDNF